MEKLHYIFVEKYSINLGDTRVSDILCIVKNNYYTYVDYLHGMCIIVAEFGFDTETGLFLVLLNIYSCRLNFLFNNQQCKKLGW